MTNTMTSLERVLTAISHKEPDRVPLMLLFSTYGAKELQLPIKDYFSSPENIVKAQLQLSKKYKTDCLYTLFYAAIEIEAFGGEVIFTDNGSPNSGEPYLKNLSQFLKLENPKIQDSKCLMKVIESTQILKNEVKDSKPIIGVVMSPFSIPVMQMGFEKYLELIYFKHDEFEDLMKKNIEFCVSWANAQIKAGATAICYFDPLASPSIIDRQTYLKTGFRVAQKTISQINGPTATHLASGITLPVIDDIINTKTAILGFSTNDNVKELKIASQNKISLLGNLNGIDMLNWNEEKAEAEVKKIIALAGQNGGLLISDNHGEIPFQTSEDVLFSISNAVAKWGKYPLNWIGDYNET